MILLLLLSLLKMKELWLIVRELSIPRVFFPSSSTIGDASERTLEMSDLFHGTSASFRTGGRIETRFFLKSRYMSIETKKNLWGPYVKYKYSYSKVKYHLIWQSSLSLVVFCFSPSKHEADSGSDSGAALGRSSRMTSFLQNGKHAKTGGGGMNANAWNEMKRNETKRNEMKRNEIKRNETKRNETK